MALFMVDGIGAVLARHRQAADLSVAQAAEKVGVSVRRFAMYEADKAAIPDDRLLAFALAVGVNPAELSLECLFHTDPDLKDKPIGQLFQQTVDEIREMEAEEHRARKSPPAKKPPGKKPSARKPTARRPSR